MIDWLLSKHKRVCVHAMVQLLFLLHGVKKKKKTQLGCSAWVVH